MAKIVFLGTAASIPTIERDNTALLVEISKTERILVDCPGSVVQKLLTINIKSEEISNVIITHSHIDHIYGLLSLVHSQFNLGNLLNIYSTKPIIKKIKKILKIMELDREKFPTIKYFNVFRKKIFYRSERTIISAFDNIHKDDSFGIKVNLKNNNIVYTSDTALMKNLHTLINEKTILIHDCTSHFSYFEKNPHLKKMHTNSKDLADYIETLKVKPFKIIPIHFLLEGKNDLKKIKKELNKIDNIVIPDDMDSIEIIKD